jgi:hypothetical protein
LKHGYLNKGGDERQSVLMVECDSLRKQATAIAEELSVAEKRASPESVNAYQDACRYAKEGADQALESAQKKQEKCRWNHNYAAMGSISVPFG